MPKLLIFTAHPAHIHQYKNICYKLTEYDWQIVFVSSLKEVSAELLNAYNFKYYKLKRSESKSLAAKYLLFFSNIFTSLKILLKERPDIVLSRLSPYGSFATKLKTIPHIAFSDTETAGFYNKLFALFVDELITPKSFRRTLKKNQIRIDGNKELSYLHPNLFQPDKNILIENGISPDEKYCILRFVSMTAYHDKGRKGISYNNKLKMISEFEKYAKIFISSESELPHELKKYQLKIKSDQIHHILGFSSLYLGDSSTMASESAILGTPAIYINDAQFGNTDDIAAYGLLFPYRSSGQDAALNKGIEILSGSNMKKEYQERRNALLQEKIDVTAFMVWFISNYPLSSKVMRETPEYQYNFK